MNFVTKYRKEIILLTFLITGYLVLRLPNLTTQPIFADEAIYIRWAQIMRAEPTLRFLPVSDGKTPLFMWALIPLFKISADPLFAGRFLSVISGFFTLLGVFFLAKNVFNLRTAFWATLLYVVTPYTVFFDRMALVDSMLSAFTVWSLYFALWLVRSLRLDMAMILGYSLGAAILTKTPGIINLLMLPVTGLLINKRSGKKSLMRIVLLWSVSIIIALIMYNLLRLGPQFQMLSSRNADYIFSPLELLGRPLDPFIPHFHDIADWFPKLLTWPILFSMIFGFIYIIIRRSFSGGVLLLWALIPILLDMAFLKTFTARYLLPSIPLLLVIGGYGVTKLLPALAYVKRLPIILMLVVLLPLPLYFDYLLLNSFEKTPLPQEERRGYFEDWTAGYGLSAIAKFLLAKSVDHQVVVGTDGYFGTLPDGLAIYLNKSKITILGGSATISAQLRNATKNNLVYFVGNKNSLEGRLQNVTLIQQYPKLKPLDNQKQDATVLYQVLP